MSKPFRFGKQTLAPLYGAASPGRYVPWVNPKERPPEDLNPDRDAEPESTDFGDLRTFIPGLPFNGNGSGSDDYDETYYYGG